MWLAGADTNKVVYEQFIVFKDKVPFIVESKEGKLFYSSDIRLNKDSILRIAFPLTIYNGFCGLSTQGSMRNMQEARNDFFTYTFKVSKELDRYYQLIFTSKCLYLECKRLPNTRSKAKEFKYAYAYSDIQNFISDGAKFIDYPDTLLINDCYKEVTKN